ncbi:Dihydrolipoyl dehydrogenase [Geodia barretti]|uniref:dihydrolipoyl dehydrogenase n=1 Tax=Geodia barretti TaxID=519541 RepID=A0AA35SUZ6_GEOBA|nr:Dihydrolipoyl dehydrogenase [Geodia barretti]
MKAAIVERDALGGICLNWGCIPSKALLRNAEVTSLIQHSEEYGITVQGVKADFSRAIDRSRRVVDRLTRGVATLLRRNGVEHISGSGSLTNANTVLVKGAEGDRAVTTDKVIIATGARQRHIPPASPIRRQTVIIQRIVSGRS